MSILVKKSEKEPYVSINKLAEYMQTGATRRRQIIKTLKEDKDFTKVYYSEVRNVLSKYFNSSYDSSIIDTVIKRIEKKKGTTAWQDTDNPNSVLALVCLKETVLPDLTDYEIVQPDEKIDSVMLGGVKVIIKPELYLKNKYSQKVGGIKFHISKTEGNRLALEGMQYVATMIKYSFTKIGYTEKEVDNNGCFSIDIFSKNFGTAPTAYKRSVDAMTAACEEIGARWPTL
jgi:hypothetical protein